MPIGRVVVVGAGPAGLIAAETLANAGVQVTVVDHMASAGRKLLIAGRGGLNLTHSEPLDTLLSRYINASPQLLDAIRAFNPDDLISWCNGLGEPTFVGSSGRVFPTAMRANKLLRAWLRRLDTLGVTFVLKTRFAGWDDAGALQVTRTAGGDHHIESEATLLALGGGSWPRTGSNGGWLPNLAAAGVAVNPLRPANSGFGVQWSEKFLEKFAWQPLKNVRLTHGSQAVRGEAMITATGIEGGAIYALGASLRQALDSDGVAELMIDLHPDLDAEAYRARLAGGRPGDSLSTRLRRVGLSPVAAGLLRELGGVAGDAQSLCLRLTSVEPIERAISTTGGIAWPEVDDSFMLRRIPGVFAAGEMLDWEAPTGGYLLQGCFSTGVAAARGVERWLNR